MTNSNDVYCWRHNWLPTGTPTAATFANVDCVKLTRKTSEGLGVMNIVTDKQNQGVYMIPKASGSNLAYNDHYWYSASGQLWVFGGSSYHGANCGLASSCSDCAWSTAPADVSARLAYDGDLNKVSSARLAALAV